MALLRDALCQAQGGYCQGSSCPPCCLWEIGESENIVKLGRHSNFLEKAHRCCSRQLELPCHSMH
eukprot:3807212-Amphidinium_carterae.1